MMGGRKKSNAAAMFSTGQGIGHHEDRGRASRGHGLLAKASSVTRLHDAHVDTVPEEDTEMLPGTPGGASVSPSRPSEGWGGGSTPKRASSESFKTSAAGKTGPPGTDDPPRPASTMDSVFDAMNNRSVADLPCYKRIGHAVMGYSLDPHSQFHTVWDLWVLVLVIVSSMWAPYKVAFLPGQGMGWFEVVMDVCFYVDIIITFWTGFDKGYEIVHDKKQVALNYLGGWFWVDFVATVQWDMLIGALFDTGGSSRTLSLCRLFKVLRLARASRLIMRLTSSWTMNTGFIDAYKLFFYVLMCAHFLGCFFFLTPELAGYEDCDSAGYEGPVTYCISSSWRGSYSVTVDNGTHPLIVTINELEPFSQYIQSVYWAMTTMTTIGYGDRGPQLEVEIIYTVFAEVIGLSFFALLITQINNLHEVLGLHEQKSNDIKNEIVGFMQYNKLRPELIHEVINFLNFKAKSHSGHSADTADAQFRYLSVPLQKKIKVEQYLPALQSVKLFGWSREDEEAEAKTRMLFNNMDKDGGGSLDENEINDLVQSLGITLTTEQLDTAIKEMDSDGGRTVAYEEFKEWWYLKKHGRPMMPRCPEMFLMSIAEKMRTLPYSPGDEVVKIGEYGDRFCMLLLGQVEVARVKLEILVPKAQERMKYQRDAASHIHKMLRRPSLACHFVGGAADTAAWPPDGTSMDNYRAPGAVPSEYKDVLRVVAFDQREPVFGLGAALATRPFERVRHSMQEVTVVATKYSDLAFVERSHLTAVLHATWPDGADHLERLAQWHYPDALEGENEIENGGVTDPGLLTVSSVVTAKFTGSALQPRRASQESPPLQELGGVVQRVDRLEDKMDRRLDSIEQSLSLLLARIPMGVPSPRAP